MRSTSENGSRDGHDEQDWLEAERTLTSGKTTTYLGHAMPTTRKANGHPARENPTPIESERSKQGLVIAVRSHRRAIS
jgi:Protein of unknown function (DUF2934)